ncbi:RNA polymerase sigma factor [Conexibacter woesei]|uniref:RNA polymerase, sigma-24 subunit, ECF subfamily n=1 Tax=Conexibacter woesei (strain DSM 14684 / CCUG 47730 / CIP 108061 / JCM 11494 / NBRC 100937 / ID131577) TaxID=469383 RepID=D3FDU8_CONWI|nr:sigma factor-like helix-turn-helix DNA-binding protein [Conexibacter woesei]ADB51564.1 RNA polymerase, sigma-24 subunit, ECF subfamily [Conexibacter woesei DSM 14684]
MSLLSLNRRGTSTASSERVAQSVADAARRVRAVGTAFDRHASVLRRLALFVAEDARIADDAVAGAFVSLAFGPDDVEPARENLLAALAGEVYVRCVRARVPFERHARPAGGRADADTGSARAARATFALLPREQRDLLVLILFGGHTRRQAARRVGLSDDAAATSIKAALRALRPPQRSR